MSISPWPVGQTQPLAATLVEDNGSVPDLSVSPTFALRFENVLSGMLTAGGGVFSGYVEAQGYVTYDWGVNDPPVTTPGTYDVYLDVTLANGKKRIFGPLRMLVV